MRQDGNTLHCSQSKKGFERRQLRCLLVWGPYVQKDISDSDGSKETGNGVVAPPGYNCRSIWDFASWSHFQPKRPVEHYLEHPDDGRGIRLKTGRFGAYCSGANDEEITDNIQLSEETGDAGIGRISEGGSEDDSDACRLVLCLGSSFGKLSDTLACRIPVSTLHELPMLLIGPWSYLKYNSTFLSLEKQEDGDVLSIQAYVVDQLVADGIINITGKRLVG
jgi:hypothetical protein